MDSISLFFDPGFQNKERAQLCGEYKLKKPLGLY